MLGSYQTLLPLQKSLTWLGLGELHGEMHLLLSTAACTPSATSVHQTCSWKTPFLSTPTWTPIEGEHGGWRGSLAIGRRQAAGNGRRC